MTGFGTKSGGLESRFAMTLFEWAKPKLARREDGPDALRPDGGDVEHDRMAVAVKDGHVYRRGRHEEQDCSVSGNELFAGTLQGVSP